MATNSERAVVNATTPFPGAALSDVLFPADYRRRVLSLLLLHPERSLHVREIARLTDTAPGTLNRELGRLHHAGLLDRRRVGNQVQYSANRSNPVFADLANILRKTTGLADVLVEALAPLAGRIDVAFVFGSMARGSESARSDVDLMVIGACEFGELIDALQAPQRELGREISPKVYSPEEWIKQLRAKSGFIENVLQRPKIYLIGNDDALAGLGREEPRPDHAIATDDSPAA